MSTIDMNRRTVVITGATTGIGKESARKLLAMGAEIVIVARDPAKIAATESELRSERPSAKVSHVRCDFASLASVRAAGAELAERHPKVHVLLNNAGVLNTEHRTTEDGHELTFQTNHLAHFLLTHALRPSLERAATASRVSRVVNVASVVHAQGVIDWNDVGGAKRFLGMTTYATTKLMNVMTTYELARRLAGKNVTANCLHPGVIGSGIGHNNRGLFGIGVRLVQPFLKSPARGAHTSVFLASSPTVENVTGRYYDDAARETRTSGASYDVAAQRKLWEATEKILELA